MDFNILENYQQIFFRAAVLLVITTIIIAACLYMKKLKNKYKTYSKLEQQFDDVTTCT